MTSSPLALLGGTPLIQRPGPHFTWPPITETTREAVLRQLDASISIYDRSGVIESLEDRLCEYFGTSHAVLTSSGTVGLYSAYTACGVQPGDEVIVPAYTFLATATPLFHLGAIPVLVDCDETGNLDPKAVKHAITARTKAVMVTHMWGIPANVPALQAVTTERDVLLLEDASHAHGAAIGGHMVGTRCAAGVFSLNGPKPLSAGEGGFVATDDDETFYRLLLHGHYNKRCRSEIPADHPLYPYATTGMGLKFRIHPLAAAVALDQLCHLDEYLDGREAIARYIIDELSGTPGINVPDIPDGHRASWYGLPLLYQPHELDGLPVDRFYRALRAEGCHEADQPGSTCPLNLHPLFANPGPLFPAYSEAIAYAAGDFPVAEHIHANTIKLPVWHRDEDIAIAAEYVNAIRKVSEHHHDLLG
ncbi:DegT/DnrJ/EryC1/StrS family aminotransferase [Dactylosporangium sp. NPDC051485]|uniref:DegT/DnrJ/EryC1/StrS family aminotransferase n=1 Tax=Dactylosporangium sp. NPDC051485 TaxID=3154846 RepID=UPI003431EE4B